jgi:hypothetical protein
MLRPLLGSAECCTGGARGLSEGARESKGRKGIKVRNGRSGLARARRHAPVAATRFVVAEETRTGLCRWCRETTRGRAVVDARAATKPKGPSAPVSRVADRFGAGDDPQGLRCISEVDTGILGGESTLCRLRQCDGRYMGLSKIYKRRKRRGAKTPHRLIGGRTGSVRQKQRAGMSAELKRHKRRDEASGSTG